MRRHPILVTAAFLVVPLLGSYCSGPQTAPELPPNHGSASASGLGMPPALSAETLRSAASASVSATGLEKPAAEHKEVHWGYAGEEGPSNWGDIKPEYAACKTGLQQAPIDLPKTAERSKDLKGVAVSYRPIPIKIINNGHTIQVNNIAPASIAVGADKYDLVRLEMHSPSEHTIDKKSFELELQLVHKNARGELAIVSLLFKKGKENKVLAPFFANVPTSVSAEDSLVSGPMLDIASLLSAKAAYYMYAGSLSSPPCTETVTWLVLEKPAAVSEKQLAKFQAGMHGPNNRPVQPLNARTVIEIKP